MELLYHYIWHHRMLGKKLRDVQGHTIEILNPGRHNEDAGPDFFNSHIIIDGHEWVGNVEIHVKASDWFRHGHDKDPAYDNVILHVVAVDDSRISRTNGKQIPQIAAVLPERFFITYDALVTDLRTVRCANMLPEIPYLTKEDWLETLAIERLHFKAERLLEYNRQLGGDWEQAVFTLLARGLGFGLNGLPFEMLAKNLPLRILYHHSDSLRQLEALLFGQAGMLDGSDNMFDEYYQSLCAEYGFLARKYGLRPMQRALWKYARTRPQNFPHRRIAMLARAVFEGVRFSSVLSDAAGNYQHLSEVFSFNLKGYWNSHTSFGTQEAETGVPKSLSEASRRLLMINVAAPFYMAYARLSGNYESAEIAYSLLSRLNAESNSKIKMWETHGIKAHDASRSQALLHLQEQYCDKNRCLECRFGNYLLRREVNSGKNLVANEQIQN